MKKSQKRQLLAFSLFIVSYFSVFSLFLYAKLAIRH